MNGEPDRARDPLILAPAEIAAVAEIARCVRRGAGEYFFVQGDAAASVYVLREGRVKIGRVTEGGRELNLEYIGPGGIFGEAALVEASPRESYAKALVAAEAYEGERGAVLELLRADHSLCAALLRIGLRRGRILEASLEAAYYRRVASRVAEFLLQLLPAPRTQESGDRQLGPRTPHLEIAGFVGSTRETVTLVLNALRRQGLVRYTDAGISIRNEEGLRAVAEGTTRGLLGRRATRPRSDRARMRA